MARRYALFVIGGAIAGIALSACGTTGMAGPRTATPTGSGATPRAMATRSSSGTEDKLSVRGGAPGGLAFAVMHTLPGQLCTIQYKHPSGKLSTTKALAPKAADPDGIVTWQWVIDHTTKPGTGSVLVTCGADIASAPIDIIAH